MCLTPYDKRSCLPYTSYRLFWQSVKSYIWVFFFFLSTLSKLKSTGAMEIFLPSLGNEEAGNKGAAYSGFYSKCKHSRENTAGRPGTALEPSINSWPSSTRCLVLLTLTNRSVPNSMNPVHQEGSCRDRTTLRVETHLPGLTNFASAQLHLRWAVGYSPPLRAPGAHAWGEVRESGANGMADNLGTVGVWALGIEYVPNVLENVSEWVPGH